MKKKWIILLYVLLILAAGILLFIEYRNKGTMEQSTLIRWIIIIIGALIGIAKTLTGRGRRGITTNKTAFYDRHYGNLIGKAFETRPKERKLLNAALDDFNADKYDASVKKLLKLNESCRGSAEQRTVSFFLGWNAELMGDTQQALQYYERAYRIVPDEVTAQNIASCYRDLGNTAKEREYLELSIRANPSYANGQNNMGQYLIRMGEYGEAIAYLETAHSLDGKLVQALSGLAICHAMEGDRAAYEQAYRKAVTLGYNGTKLKAFIQSLEPPIEV